MSDISSLDEDLSLPPPNETNGHHAPQTIRGVLEMESGNDDDEDEFDSLIQETTGDLSNRHFYNRPAFNLTRRKPRTFLLASSSAQQESFVSRIRGYVRESIGHAFSSRNFVLLTVLSIAVGLLLYADGQDSEIVPEDVFKKPPHQSSFINNDPSFTDIPKSNVGYAVSSFSYSNAFNDEGFYLHHPYRSPYTHQLYGWTSQQQDDLQQQFDDVLSDMKQRYGEWHFDVDSTTTSSTKRQMMSYDYKDMPLEDLLSTAWQRNATYLQDFLKQSLLLVRRVQEAIWNEYGFQWTDPKTKQLFEVIVENDVVLNERGIAVDAGSNNVREGIAYLSPAGMDGLVRKLLHAMFTEDELYVVAVGRANTYRAVNWRKTQIMQFNYVMEPVLDNLGVRLVSRNMGMDASTTISALGGADVYGEADIFWYIDDPREGVEPETIGQMDLLHRQAILSGERMPVILTPHPTLTDENSHSKVWMGNLQPGVGVCPESGLSEKDDIILPSAPACHYVQCSEKAQIQGKCAVYESSCWVHRTDWNPTSENTQQNENAGFQNQEYPNANQHQWEGRKLALLVLNALEKAVTFWSDQVETGNVPLSTDLWHVRDTYDAVRESVRSLERKPGEIADMPSCEQLFSAVDPMICHIQMHVLTEWTPRVDNYENRLTSYASIGYEGFNDHLVQLYFGVDLLPVEWQIPKRQVDVHMVATATNQTVQEGWRDGNDFVSTYGDDFYPMEDDFVYHRIRRRDLVDDTALGKVADSAWTLFAAPLGFCDGSSQSQCNRKLGNHCLLANHNHYRAGLVGHGNSDWLHFVVRVTEGIILLRFDWSMELNDGTMIVSERSNSQGGSRLEELPSDFSFSYSINGVDKSVEKTLSKDEFLDFGVQVVDDLIVYPVLRDKEMSRNTDENDMIFWVGVRIQTAAGSGFRVILTHVYYA